MTGDWEAWVGHQRTSSCLLDPAQANRMAVTLDRDPDFAEGDPLPPAWNWLYFHDVLRASELGPDGHPELGRIMPPVPLPRRMWAAGEFAFLGPARLGEWMERVSTITAVTPKVGRTGPLFFVTVRHDHRSGNQTRILEQQTIVYRELSPEPTERAEAGSGAPRTPDFAASWRLDSTALFRYSALTFNGHRIHYDKDYAREVEGYPDLVVHGPLLATLLLDLAHTNARPLSRFVYRARNPVFLPDPFSVNGSVDGSTTQLWARTHDGRMAMEATAFGG